MLGSRGSRIWDSSFPFYVAGSSCIAPLSQERMAAGLRARGGSLTSKRIIGVLI